MPYWVPAVQGLLGDFGGAATDMPLPWKERSRTPSVRSRHGWAMKGGRDDGVVEMATTFPTRSS